jgi:hypothetical protein
LTAADALNVARTTGVHVRIEGDALVLSAASPAPAGILDLLVQHKAGIIALLQPGPDDWSAMDWRACFEERAGILEHDAGMPRSEAEAHALAYTALEWLRRNPVSSAPCCCLSCGQGEASGKALLAFGGEPTGHAWLHGLCWPSWYAGRKAQALTNLAAMGIPGEPVPPDP